jgi:hypothetical protein
MLLPVEHPPVSGTDLPLSPALSRKRTHESPDFWTADHLLAPAAVQL